MCCVRSGGVELAEGAPMARDEPDVAVPRHTLKAGCARESSVRHRVLPPTKAGGWRRLAAPRPQRRGLVRAGRRRRPAVQRERRRRRSSCSPRGPHPFSVRRRHGPPVIRPLHQLLRGHVQHPSAESEGTKRAGATVDGRRQRERQLTIRIPGNRFSRTRDLQTSHLRCAAKGVKV